MPQFQTIEEAFEWFLENTFPELPTEDKRKLKDAKYAFYKDGLKVSTIRMKRILSEYGNFETYHIFDPK
jgi:hypothetical protein